MLAPLVLIVACGVLASQLRHVVGAAPVLGAVLCASCFLRPRALWVVGMGGLLVRELLTGLEPFTLVRMTGLIVVLAAIQAMRVKPTLRSLSAGLLVAVPLFHLTLAVGDWATGTCAGYPRTAAGLWATVISAVPYMARSFWGEAASTALFFGLAAVTTVALQGRRSAATAPSV